PGATTVIVISHDAWQRHFGGDPAIVGRTVTFDAVLGPPVSTKYVIVGVMPRTFQFPDARTHVWRVPPPAWNDAPAVGRLADGVSLSAALSEIAAVVRAMRAGQRDNARARYELVREQDEVVGSGKPALIVLMADG